MSTSTSAPSNNIHPNQPDNIRLGAEPPSAEPQKRDFAPKIGATPQEKKNMEDALKLEEEIEALRIKRGSGQPPKLDPQLSTLFAKLIRMGCFAKTACNVVGITEETFYTWMKRGVSEQRRLQKDKRAKPRKKEALYRQFSESILKEAGVSETLHVGTIYQAAIVNKDPQWAAWWLTHRFPRRYSPKTAVELTGPGGGPVKTLAWDALIKDMTIEELEALDKIATKLAGIKTFDEEIEELTGAEDEAEAEGEFD